MAFYNSGLRLLRHVRDAELAGTPFMTVEHAVHRMTELGRLVRLDAPATWRVGDRADLVVIDPEALDDRLEAYAENTVDGYGGMARMVNRNDDAVTAVLVAGRTAVRDGVPTPIVGCERTGSSLRHGRIGVAPACRDERAGCPLRTILPPSFSAMWAALSDRDWEAEEVRSQDCILPDMPVGPAALPGGPTTSSAAQDRAWSRWPATAIIPG